MLAYPVLAPLIVWQRIIVVYAVLLAAEGALLAVVTQLCRRPVFERLLALAPAIAFCWAALVAREMRLTAAGWSAYVSWVLAHYPASFAQHAYDGLDAAVTHAQRTAVLVLMVTLAMGVLGWALLLPQHAAAPIPVEAAAPATQDDALEITIEPIE
jgi:hypothetical protein